MKSFTENSRRYLIFVLLVVGFNKSTKNTIKFQKGINPTEYTYIMSMTQRHEAKIITNKMVKLE